MRAWLCHVFPVTLGVVPRYFAVAPHICLLQEKNTGIDFQEVLPWCRNAVHEATTQQINVFTSWWTT